MYGVGVCVTCWCVGHLNSLLNIETDTLYITHAVYIYIQQLNVATAWRLCCWRLLVIGCGVCVDGVGVAVLIGVDGVGLGVHFCLFG